MKSFLLEDKDLFNFHISTMADNEGARIFKCPTIKIGSLQPGDAASIADINLGCPWFR